MLLISLTKKMKKKKKKPPNNISSHRHEFANAIRGCHSHGFASRFMWIKAGLKPPWTHRCSLCLVLRKVQQVAPHCHHLGLFIFLSSTLVPSPSLLDLPCSQNITATSDLLLFFLPSMPPQSTCYLKTKLACQTRMCQWLVVVVS